MSLFAGFRRRDDRWADKELVDSLVWSFREACIGAGVSLAVDARIAGTGYRTPEVTYVQLGPPVRLTVRMLPGQVPAQLQKVGRLIAPHLGGLALRVEDRGHGWALVTVLTVDPLAGTLPLHVDAAPLRVLLGRDEDGQGIDVDPLRLPHTIVQGTTRSGKSVFVYGLLAQLARRTDVLVTGVDPTGLVFRPFAGTRHADWQVSGLRDVAAVEKLLTRVVDEMDRRIGALPLHRDSAELTDEQPAIVVVLEEWAGTLKVLDAAKTRGDDPGARVRALVSRLLAEGAKVGIKVLILVQRAEANVVGALERSLCTLRISFWVDSLDSVKLLHPGVDPAVADEHTTATPGIGLLTIPDRTLTRFRAPFIGDYEAYARAIQATAGE